MKWPAKVTTCSGGEWDCESQSKGGGVLQPLQASEVPLKITPEEYPQNLVSVLGHLAIYIQTDGPFPHTTYKNYKPDFISFRRQLHFQFLFYTYNFAVTGN